MPTPPAQLDNQAILAMHEAGLSTRRMETILGKYDHVTIARRLKHLNPRSTTEIYKSLKPDILAEKQRSLLMKSNKLTPREQADISKAYKNYYECERLERGQSTTNVSQINLDDRLRQALKASIYSHNTDIEVE